MQKKSKKFFYYKNSSKNKNIHQKNKKIHIFQNFTKKLKYL